MTVSDFQRKMCDILNFGALNLAMAIGYKHGIFEAMDAIGDYAPVDTISRKSGLDPRYIREWLGVMATGGIVEISWREEISRGHEISGKDEISRGQAREELYRLPEEHAALLTRGAGAANLGVYTQEIPLLTCCAMDAVEKGFKSGEGIPFSFYPSFQSFMSQISNAKHRDVLVDKFLPQVDGGRILAGLEKGIRVCDIGCGEGVALNLMAQSFPKSGFTGIDNDPDAIETARNSTRDMGLGNVAYLIEDAALVGEMDDFKNRFDYITAFDAIHDQTRPLETLKGIRKMLANPGVFSMVDINAGSSHHDNIHHPMGPFLYTVSLMHCMPVGLGEDGRGSGLGMMWGRERALELLGEAGFTHVDILEMAHDGFNVHYQCKLNF
ncbi:MAG: class I SAM-dependent methyltransferase [Desulfamplus sp.]|nr:class I SAM-dependent methyltransferase [Desulfamplus sp.]